MSIWFQHTVTALGDRAAIGKFFNLDPEKDIHYIDSFTFSFGQKNVPGLRLGKLIEQNKNLIFLIEQSSDYDTVWWLERFVGDTHQHIQIGRFAHAEYGGNQINKLILEKYAEKFPYLMAKHEAGTRAFDWKHFFNDFDTAAAMLSQADQYKEMTPYAKADLEFDNQELEDHA